MNSLPPANPMSPANPIPPINNTTAPRSLAPRSNRARRLAQQLALFRHLALILHGLMERLGAEHLAPDERRALQRELAALKKAAQAARRRLRGPRHP